MKAIREDPELMKTYKKYEEDYDNKRGGGGKEKRQQQCLLLPQQEQHGDNDNNNNNGSYYKYGYFVIRHYDPELRKQQKLDRKRGTKRSRADGKIECGPFKETDLPPIVVEELRRKKENRRSLS